MKEFDEMLKDLGKKFEEEESKLKTFLKRVFILFMFAVVLFLFLSYLGPGWRILNILEGQVDSRNLEENKVYFKGNIIEFKDSVYEDLKKLYFENQDKEFKVCLFGERKDNLFFIDGLKIPEVISRSFSHVQAEFCSTYSLISLHKHPEKSCIFSEQDVVYYEAYSKLKEEAIIGLMCEIDRFNFYGF